MLEALEAQVRLEVRLAYAQLTSDRDIVEIYSRMIPVHQEIVGETLRQYNYMLKGVYDILRTKQEEIKGQSEYVNALRDYWITRAQLEHAVGQALPGSLQGSVTPRESEQSHNQGGHK